jgi:hypothetical protein
MVMVLRLKHMVQFSTAGFDIREVFLLSIFFFLVEEEENDRVEGVCPHGWLCCLPAIYLGQDTLVKQRGQPHGVQLCKYNGGELQEAIWVNIQS